MFSFVNFFKNGVFPAVKADDEIPAPQEILAEQCKESAALKKLQERWDQCTSRVETLGSKTDEVCGEEAIDFFDALVKCVDSSLASKVVIQY